MNSNKVKNNNNEVDINILFFGVLHVSDKKVFQISIFLSILLCFFQLASVYSDEIVKNEPLVVSFTEKKDYSVLLSSLFGNVGKEVPSQAYEWTKRIDEYRVRIARQAEQNIVLFRLIENLTDGLPYEKRDEYDKKISNLNKMVEKHKSIVVPIIENDAFLSKAIRSSYGLYGSFVLGFIEKVSEGNPVETLDELQAEVFQTYNDLAVLYTQVKNIIK